MTILLDDSTVISLMQGLGAIPPSAFYSPEHSHLSGKYIRFHFAKVHIM